MTPSTLLETIIDPALRLVETKYRTDEARALLIAIALQESEISERRQTLNAGRWWLYPTSPGTGFWMFEAGGAVHGVLKHPVCSAFIGPVLKTLEYPSNRDIIHDALVHNDVLACLMARALLLSLPAPLPARGDHEEGWRQYIEAWQPGKPKPDKWPRNYAAAWRCM